MYRAQQLEVITEMLRAMEDRQITALETQNIINAALSFGMSLVFMTALGALVRSFVIEALEEPEEEKVLPVVGAILPQTETEKPKFGLWDCYLDPRNAYAEARSLRQHGWQVRVTERLTPQDRKYCVWVRKRLPERLPQTTPLVSAAEIFSRAREYFGTTPGPENTSAPPPAPKKAATSCLMAPCWTSAARGSAAPQESECLTTVTSPPPGQKTCRPAVLKR